MKKVLIISYYWPPAGGPGVQRWLKFTKYLREFDIEPVLYVPENAHYPLLDPSLEKEVPPDITILKNKIIEPYALSGLLSRKQTSTISSGIIADRKKQSFLEKVMLFVRGNLFIPDARRFWIKPSVKFLGGYLQKENISAVITTGPPHSLHLIGMGLKAKYNIRWLADFRDPWTNIGYHKKLRLTKKAAQKHRQLEKKVLNSADHIITTSFTTAAEFKTKTSKPVSIITNGYDRAGEGVEISYDEFTISHIGSLLSGRDPACLWQALGELKRDNADFARDLLLELTGAVSEDVLSSIKKAGLAENLKVRDYVSHPEALKLQRTAAILLLVEINSQETKGIIPGKLFEYLAAGRPILAVGPENWDVERILTSTYAGKTFKYSDKAALKKEILSYYSLFKNNSLSPAFKNIERYSRKSLTGELAKIIKKEWE